MSTEASNPPAAARRTRATLLSTVASRRRLSPQMVRIVLTGDDLVGFEVGEFTDHYVKVQLPPPGADYEPPFSVEEIRAERPRELWPRVRTYTVAAWDVERTHLTIDFVCHGDSGVAGPWAEAAEPGDRLQIVGPGGGYAPDPAAGSHLMVGDLCVVPAIEAALARIAEGVPVRVMIEVDDPAEIRELSSPGELELSWHLRDGAGSDLIDTLRAAELGPDPQLFIHGEAGMVREARRVLLNDRGLRGEHPSISGYWKRRRTEEGWREDKPEWKRLVAADDAARPS